MAKKPRRKNAWPLDQAPSILCHDNSVCSSHQACTRHLVGKLHALDQANAIQSPRNDRFGQSCVYLCVFGNPQSRPIQCCAMSVRCVFIAPGISWPNWMASNKRDPLCATMVGSVKVVRVWVFLVTLNVCDLRQGYDLADNISHAMTPIMSHAHWDKQHARMLSCNIWYFCTEIFLAYENKFP